MKMLIFLALTIGAYQAFAWVYRRGRHHALLNPVAWTVAVIVLYLRLRGLTYAAYFEQVRFLNFLLGPATVALAVPLYEQRAKLRAAFTPLIGSLFAGSACGILSAWGIARAFGAPREILLSLAPKSVTTPIAIAICERIGGIPSLTAVYVITTGIFGAITLPPLLRACGFKSKLAQGFALGVAAHGVGTARAFQESEEVGAFAGLALALNGLLTAILVPIFLRFL
jgi:predicted murein hydrolase (TIGR00659 family)